MAKKKRDGVSHKNIGSAPENVDDIKHLIDETEQSATSSQMERSNLEAIVDETKARKANPNTDKSVSLTVEATETMEAKDDTTPDASLPSEDIEDFPAEAFTEVVASNIEVIEADDIAAPPHITDTDETVPTSPVVVVERMVSDVTSPVVINTTTATDSTNQAVITSNNLSASPPAPVTIVVEMQPVMDEKRLKTIAREIEKRKKRIKTDFIEMGDLLLEAMREPPHGSRLQPRIRT